MINLYLLLGGNLGDKETIFSEARFKLNNLIGKIEKQSAVYETEPWGFQSSDIFWNQALEIATSLTPEEVLEHTQQIELDMGRIRKESQYTSRIIDIDILFYADEIVELPHLLIPHPRIQDRKFALLPLAEIAPKLQHPILNKSIVQLLAECSDQLRVVKVENQGKREK